MFESREPENGVDVTSLDFVWMIGGWLSLGLSVPLQMCIHVKVEFGYLLAHYEPHVWGQLS